MSGWSVHNLVVPDTASVHVPSMITESDVRSKSEQRHDDDEDAMVKSSSLMDNSAFVRGGSALFCTKENLFNSVAYINQEFQLLGLPCLKLDSSQGSFDTIAFINRMYDLLTLYNKTLAVKEDLENKNHRFSCEADHNQSTNMRMKRLQEQTDRELDQEREKYRQINLKYKQLCSKLKTEKEEVKRLTAVIQSRDLQHKHEHKKKEKEVYKLKERLHQLLADKVPDRKVGMDLMNVVGRSEGRRATWKSGPGKQEEEMYQLLIGNYEDRHRELMHENGELRDCLLSLQRELSALLKRTGDMSVSSNTELPSHVDVSSSSSDDQGDTLEPSSSLSITDLGEGYFQMPYDMIRHEIERTFKETCDQISESMKKSLIRNVTKGHPSIVLSKSVSSTGSEKDSSERRQSLQESVETERLKKQVAKYKTIIQQQEDLIQQSINSQSQSMEHTFLHESQLLKEKQNLSEQKKLFFEEKSNFEKERRTFSDIAIRLGKERQALQEERANFLKQHFLNLNPFKEDSNKRPKEDGHPSRLLPATPVFSPAKSGALRTSHSNLPTTTDLYKALGLSPSKMPGFNPTTTMTDTDKKSNLSMGGLKPSTDDSVSVSFDVSQSPAEAAACLASIKTSLLQKTFQISQCDVPSSDASTSSKR